MYSIKRVFVIFVFLCFSCGDTVKLKQEDVVKYEWLKPFVIGVEANFEGTHDIDNGSLKFTYKVKDTKYLISKLDEISMVEKWSVNQLNDTMRVYTKDILMYGEVSKKTNINVIYYDNKSKVSFDVN